MSRTRKRILWSGLALAVFALPKLKRKPQPTRELRSALPKTPNAAATPNKTKERVEGEIVSLTPHGFEPTEIIRPHKHFVLVIDNRSGLAQIELRLDREHGGRIREVQIAREQRNWSDDLDLTPGRYVLSEANHPSWGCNITITAN